MLKQVRSYETSDNKLFTDRSAALTHQFQIDLRGLMQSNGIGKQAAPITVSDIASFIAGHATEINTAIVKYRDSIRRIKK